MKVENWQGHSIRFVEQNGDWWAILKDICDAMGLRVAKVAERLDPDMILRVKVGVSDVPLKDLRSRGDNEYRWMLAVNELGVYDVLFRSKRLEARKLRRWTYNVLRKLRDQIGLEKYEVMRMMDQDVQEDIDHFLDTLFFDEETGMLMESRTVAGGDVIQVPFDDQELFEG